MNELPSCPFCGEKEEIVHRREILSGEDYVKCQVCGSASKIWKHRVIKWIPVIERLPDKDGWYAVKVSTLNNPCISKYDETIKEWDAKAVTHWQEDHTFDYRV